MTSPFHLLDLLQSLDITLATVEACREEGSHELPGELPADDLRAEAEHVHVVVLDALMRGVGVVTDRRADPGDLAGGERYVRRLEKVNEMEKVMKSGEVTTA